MTDKKLFLLDGHALVYRAHYAFINRPLINSKKVDTGAITGFLRTLWDLIQNQKPSHIAVAFDPKSTFRHDMYPEYKANRDAQPEAISIAMPYIRKIVEGFKIPIVEVPNYEADDVIGTLAKQAEKEGYTVYMVTPDKDYGQLVSENIFMYKPSRQGNGIDIVGVKEILEQWELDKPEQVIDILGLMGHAAADPKADIRLSIRKGREFSVHTQQLLYGPETRHRCLKAQRINLIGTQGNRSPRAAAAGLDLLAVTENRSRPTAAGGDEHRRSKPETDLDQLHFNFPLRWHSPLQPDASSVQPRQRLPHPVASSL